MDTKTRFRMHVPRAYVAIALILCTSACQAHDDPPPSPSMARVECMDFLGGPLCVEKCR